jgi:cobalt/nickel transport system permease protein
MNGILDALHHDGDSAVHRLPPAAKVAGTVLFVFAVVATPRGAFAAFAVHAAVVVLAARAARLPARWVLGRMRVELPFVAFAVLLPVLGGDDGWWAAWNILAKATLGVAAAVVLAGSTPVAELLAGLDRLRLPRALTAIAGFMVRYLDVIAGEAGRMRVARLSRGDDPRWLWQSRAIASSAGTLFVRAYERGERVHLAMLSRGFTGTMPPMHHHEVPAHASMLALLPAAVAATVAIVAHVT